MSDQLQEIIDRAIPVFAMGGLSGAMYPIAEDSDEDVDGYAVDIHDWKVLADAARKVANPDYEEAAYTYTRRFGGEPEYRSREMFEADIKAIVDSALGIDSEDT